MKKLIALLLISSTVFAGQKYGFNENPHLEDEMVNNYKEHRYPNWVAAKGGKLTITSGGTDIVRGVVSSQISSDLASAHFSGMKAKGTPSALLPVAADDYITAFTAHPYDGFRYLIPSLAGFRVSPGTVVSNGFVATDFIVNTSSGTPDGYERLRISWDGYFGINQPVNTVNRVGTFNIDSLANSNGLRVTGSDPVYSVVNAVSGGNASSLNVDSSSKSITFAGAGSPPNAQALCISGGVLGHCTSAVGAGGGCTCTTP